MTSQREIIARVVNAWLDGGKETDLIHELDKALGAKEPPMTDKTFSARDLQRFWSFLPNRPDDGCWEWNGSRLPAGGYGQIGVKIGDAPRKSFRAHRMSYLVNRGEIPSGLFVCHRCDNPPCCNPVHLFLGTHKDNMADASRKGRNARPCSSIRYCPQGHEYTPENTYYWPKKMTRKCRICMKAQAVISGRNRRMRKAAASV